MSTTARPPPRTAPRSLPCLSRRAQSAERAKGGGWSGGQFVRTIHFKSIIYSSTAVVYRFVLLQYEVTGTFCQLITIKR